MFSWPTTIQEWALFIGAASLLIAILAFLFGSGLIPRLHGRFWPVKETKANKALLTARLMQRENGNAIIEIKNIGQATAKNIRISFAGRLKAHVATGKSASLPGSTKIPAGESISIPIECPDWKEIDVDMRWTDDSGKDNDNKTYIPLKPI
jgi:hypothetical protein